MPNNARNIINNNIFSHILGIFPEIINHLYLLLCIPIQGILDVFIAAPLSGGGVDLSIIAIVYIPCQYFSDIYHNVVMSIRINSY